MEDKIKIIHNYLGQPDCEFIGVFDGHAGIEASEFASERLPIVLEKKLKQLQANESLEDLKTPEECLRASFIETNLEMKNNKVKGGSTAVVSLFMGGKGWVANCGDSRAVLYQYETTSRYSFDHKPSVPAEQERIQSMQGGIVTTIVGKQGTVYRVQGILSVSRSFGDFILEPYITVEPFISKVIELSDCLPNGYLILACDGLWDVISDEESTDMIKNIWHPTEAAEFLRDTAFNRGSTDNISVVVIRLPQMPRIKSISPIIPSNPSSIDISTQTPITTAKISMEQDSGHEQKLMEIEDQSKENVVIEKDDREKEAEIMMKTWLNQLNSYFNGRNSFNEHIFQMENDKQPTMEPMDEKDIEKIVEMQPEVTKMVEFLSMEKIDELKSNEIQTDPINPMQEELSKYKERAEQAEKNLFLIRHKLQDFLNLKTN